MVDGKRERRDALLQEWEDIQEELNEIQRQHRREFDAFSNNSNLPVPQTRHDEDLHARQIRVREEFDAIERTEEPRPQPRPLPLAIAPFATTIGRLGAYNSDLRSTQSGGFPGGGSHIYRDHAPPDPTVQAARTRMQRVLQQFQRPATPARQEPDNDLVSSEDESASGDGQPELPLAQDAIRGGRPARSSPRGRGYGHVGQGRVRGRGDSLRRSERLRNSDKSGQASSRHIVASDRNNDASDDDDVEPDVEDTSED